MKLVILLSVVSLSMAAADSLDLRGKWKEDQNLREGLSDFLYEMGKHS
jgi:hypothetical protein